MITMVAAAKGEYRKELTQPALEKTTTSRASSEVMVGAVVWLRLARIPLPHKELPRGLMWPMFGPNTAL